MKWIKNLIHWIKRNCYLLFMPEKCMKITMEDNWFQYGDVVITFGDTKLKCLEKGWFYRLEKDSDFKSMWKKL